MTDNEGFIRKTFDDLGFGDFFNDALAKGIKNKAPEIVFEPGQINIGKAKLEFKPKVVQKEDDTSFYLVKGISVTRTEGKDVKTQFLPVYKNYGFNPDQADKLLQGETVRNVEDVVDRKPVWRYSQLDFSQTTKWGNYKLNHAPEDHSLLQVLSQVGILGGAQEKQNIVNGLLAGKTVQGVRSDEKGKNETIEMRLGVRPKNVLGVDVMDDKGGVKQKFPERAVYKMQAVQGKKQETKLSSTTKDLMTAGANQQAGAKQQVKQAG